LAEAGSYGTARTGNWLWAVLVGAVLLVMELILFAALVPATWSQQVRDTELAWLHQGLGPSTANAVIERAEHWYGALFVEPALVETSYRITLPNEEDVARAGALSPLASLRVPGRARRHRRSPATAAVGGLGGGLGAPRIRGVRLSGRRCGGYHQAGPGQRLANARRLVAVSPASRELAAAWGDGWVRRRIRQAGFAYASPVLAGFSKSPPTPVRLWD
jgi:hypothetical protein